MRNGMLALSVLAAVICAGIVLTVVSLLDGQLRTEMLLPGLILLTCAFVGSLGVSLMAMIMGGSLLGVPRSVRYCAMIGILAGLGPVNIVLGVVAYFHARKAEPWSLAE